ncbi:alanine/glycine:cation symporter family protein [Spirulina sp. CS-785/01]|uniref:alanine/glycine:cation symporter family protein n=1 Tax=Spirulina sp. CS-785/01 TaxID=3021716 RepID=UPI00232EB86E|nr:alanine/glycine:cation symporter family protein [Spirulina sp. CS-785/01]MDB9315978.1 alanine/glycine:cation symporter family protein [Spirulina sp. CS-785/01]
MWLNLIQNLLTIFDERFTQLVDFLFAILFFKIAGFPFIILWIIVGGVFFTLRTNIVNKGGLTHAIDIARGKYDEADEEGEVSSFQALATALSATVGLGSIAGVAIAISIGGPGASLWMTCAGLLAMNVKFVECTLGQKYRLRNPDGTMSGGPMRYISQGLAEKGQETLGKVCAAVFAVFCVFGTWGACGMFQASQSYQAVEQVIPVLSGWMYGLMLVALVALVILGGIERIGQVTGWIVPIMCGVYVLTALLIILLKLDQLIPALQTIISDAFTLKAGAGGLLGTVVQGFRRGAFSCEMGLGSAAIAHSASRQTEPVREGFIASLEPAIATGFVCNITALVIVITEAYQVPEYADFGGAQLTSAAFGSVIGWFPNVLAIAAVFFAFSTMISWGYYGERCWDYLFGQETIVIYKVLLLGFIFLGTITNPQSAIKFSDAMLLSMSFPNILGLYLLSGNLKAELKDYIHRLRTGEIAPVESVESVS